MIAAEPEKPYLVEEVAKKTMEAGRGQYALIVYCALQL